MQNLLSVNKSSTVPRLVFDILSDGTPLTAKEVFASVKRRRRGGVTYQAVFKALKRSVEEGVLTEEGKRYAVNADWLARTQAICAKTAARVQKPALLGLEGTQTYVLESFYAVDKFLLEAFEGIAPTLKEAREPIYLEWTHFWIPLFFGRETYTRFAAFPEVTKTYCVAKNDTPLDRWCADYWRERGASVALKKGSVAGPDHLIIGDTVIQVYYPKKLAEKLSAIYRKATSIDRFDADTLFKTVFEKKAEVPVVIQRNGVLATHLKKEVLANFRESYKGETTCKPS